ncbi:SIR2 family protein [Mycolicibacterium arseniciresistens]|uniref:SIR2 family protein n=1 Tax=Mycolicibacterium arseniciresistens TaxID=3062257 RepID=A0ABT8UFS6_9MYCO|nr:SIR2 family protein [Mycolicibacterium arseniciresistens]MDO3636041.1 SIR2 family protein [Mycolicibacterium arseniciresistens]
MPIARFELVEEYGEAVLSGNAALFIGAGISQGAGLPGWDGLLDPIRTSCNVPKHHDYPLVAEYIANELAGGVTALHDYILQELTTAPFRPALNHRLIARLRVPQVWTTNYDPLLELAMTAAGEGHAVAVDEQTIRLIASNQRAVIKMHGSISGDPAGWDALPVITRTDYERYEIDHPRMWTVLRATYLSRTMLFLGFSFVDPNVEILLRLARTLDTAPGDRHVAVLKTPDPHKADELRLHQLRIDDFQNSGIRVCEIADYGEITEILTQLLRRTRPARLFVSGSAAAGTTTADEDEQILGAWCLAIARELDRETDWEIASLQGPSGWLVTRDVAALRRIEGRYDPAKLTFHFRKKSGPPVQLPDRVGTAIYADRTREELVVDLLDESRAMLVVRGGSKTTEEIEWAVARDVGVVPLACSGGAAYDYWEANQTAPPGLGARPTDTGLWARLNDPDPANAAEAAHQLLAQAMYQR